MDLAASDTLVFDSVRVASWQSDPAFAYNQELMTPDVNIFGWLSRQLGKLLNRIFSSQFADEYTGLILICIGVVLLIFIGWLIYRKRPGLFTRHSKNKLPYTVEEDTIYGIDFAAAIEKALLQADYKDAVRLLYLQTLKMLSDNGRIDWQLYKTPTQYVREVKLPVFRQFTTHFLRVRYGNFEASQALFDSMKAQQGEIERGVGV